MARPQKVSLDYFSCDVRILDDPKVALVMAEHGPIVANVIIRLLGEIYGGEGYFLQWDADRAALFALNTCHGAVTTEQSLAIVESLIRRGFFDAETYQRTGRLTSRGIQTRWQMAVSASRRTCRIDPDLDLLHPRANGPNGCPKNRGGHTAPGGTPVFSGETPVSSEETHVSPSENPTNKRKENKSKYYTPLPPSSPTAPPEPADPAGPFCECSRQEEITLFAGRVIDAWNETFPGPERRVSPMNQPLYPQFRAAVIDAFSEGITVETLRSAFASLRDTPRLSWGINAAIKPDNVRLLLTERLNKSRAPTGSEPMLQLHGSSPVAYTTEQEFFK